MNKYLLLFTIIGILIAVGFVSQKSKTLEKEEESKCIEEEHTYQYGFSNNWYFFDERVVKPDEFMADFFQDFGVPYENILLLEKRAKKVADLRKIKSGNTITCVKTHECANPEIFIYQIDPIHYVTYHMYDSVYAEVNELPSFTTIETGSGVIKSSLWNAVVHDKALSIEIVDKMEDALATFDFTTAQVGDQFKFVYEKRFINDKPAGIGKLYAAYYNSGANEFEGFYYENEKYQGYYDFEGRPTKRQFLKSPIRARYRISSPFNMRRFHPIDKRVKPHLGTDYAAAYGTPIRAVASGKVVKATRTKNNGKFVKIRHNKTYQTQYLHMQGFASGIRSGAHVKQGQTIGYVGSTGKATGPHVCFRFWKNGRQIDHRRLNFPPLNPLPKSQINDYFAERDIWKSCLDQVFIDTTNSVVENIDI